jgi:uncharacterized protein YcgI (DUF1989 family)
MNHDIPGAAVWSAPVRAGRSITLTALADGVNASVLIIGADRLDRLNVPDTLKSQMSARIRSGMVLMSDRGLALATVVASTLDWHDCLTGLIPDRLLMVELAKHGFGAADVHGCINFFSKVGISDDSRASLTIVPNHALAGDSVTLRAEQDLLVFISTAAHPLSDAAADGAAVRVEVGIDRNRIETADDHLELREEALRALELTRGLMA